MKQTNFLIIEDDPIVSRTIERSLRSSENRIRLASSGVEGLKAARWEVPDIVILDVVLPGMDGYTVCKELRADTLLTDVPVLFLTARSGYEDKIAGFSVGADDYMSKPFNVDELLLRIQAILRRSRNQKKQKYSQYMSQTSARSEPAKKVDSTNITIGPYTLCTRTYYFDGPGIEKIRLTPVQYDIIYHLMSHPGEVFTPSRLLDEIWDYPSDAGSADLVRVHIKNIRDKVEKDPHHPTFIRTVSGFGYTIDAIETQQPGINYGSSRAQ
jgi:two-component system, OmpR family, response regulator RpaA